MTELELELIALEEFKNVPDDGLFPNYTDRDIWIAGFVAAARIFNVDSQDKI